MAMQDKIIAGVLLLHGTLGAVWTAWAVFQLGFPVAFLAANLALVAVGVGAGVGSFCGRRWAPYLGAAFYLIQLVHVFTSTFQWSFTLGFHLNIALGWLSSGELGINLLALVMLGWMGVRALARDRSSRPTPLRGRPY